MIQQYSTMDQEWDDLVKSFNQYDIYFLKAYVRCVELHGDGEAFLLYYTNDKCRALTVLMKRSIDGYSELYDVFSPYGYGGFLTDGKWTEESIAIFRQVFEKQMIHMSCVCAFFRMHPLIVNDFFHRSMLDLEEVGSTISMEIDSLSKIDQNMSSKHRNMLRKAQKNGLEVDYGNSPDLLNRFIEMYELTMNRQKANPYYYFSKNVYTHLFFDSPESVLIFYAHSRGEIMSMAMILMCNKNLHYHLAAFDYNYHHLAPNNILLREIAAWGAAHGYEKFHLGGGVGVKKDSLYKFKLGFNPSSPNQFCVGKYIFQQDIYDQLVNKRILEDNDFDDSSHFFPLYRA